VSMSQPHPGQVIRSGGETFLRILFGLFMAVIAIALAVLPWPVPFECVTVLVMLFAAREWHRMVRSPAQREAADHQPIHVQTSITGATVALAVAALAFGLFPIAFAFLVAGAAVAYFFARRRDDNPIWHAVGVLYIGLPALALVGLRILPAKSQGVWFILGLFVIVWATDTGALVFGKLIGGKKLAPRLSPGKTWAGTIGGTVTAVVIFAIFTAVFAVDIAAALAFAAALSIVAHLGDLLESAIKRHFGYKDSGGLIPGHGGMLDRVDSLFAASVVMALIVFGLHFNPLLGGHA
jgi:phosphatidate cytidylyltransferase